MLKADERIEKLLNCFGQTISDLPKGRDYMHKDKLIVSMKNADRQAFDWFNPELRGEFDFFGLHAYICHLADVIDRMEVALETAKLTMDCRLCKTCFPVCQLHCETHAKVTDWQLSGMDQYDFKEFVEGEGQKDA